MDAIKSYLENMFLHLPKTAEVLRAKEELAQMKEDKYNQLRSEGRTDNEAVGQVISEFGNLAELAGTLGIPQEVKDLEVDTKQITTTGRTRPKTNFLIRKPPADTHWLPIGPYPT